ncbi:Uncharacterised protein [uncultured archaeon]|nr:Uncharacterised protein [uncultured archaeon]
MGNTDSQDKDQKTPKHKILIPFARILDPEAFESRPENEGHPLVSTSFSTIHDFRFTKSFIQNCNSGGISELIPRIFNACKELVAAKDLGNGYFISFSRCFLYNAPFDGQKAFRGLYLTLNRSSSFLECPPYLVGVLRFKVGFPFEIDTIQGNYGKEPQKFFEKTGKHYYDVLLSRMVETVGVNLQPGLYGANHREPKIIFNLYSGHSYKFPTNFTNRLANIYLSKNQRDKIISNGPSHEFKGNVRHALLARAARRQAQGI